MSKIQKQVIFHVKKSSQNFSLDYGLNRLGFFKFRRLNLRDNFLRICSINRQKARIQLGTVMQHRFKNAHLFSLSLKSYSAFFLSYISKYFRTYNYRMYDVNLFSYINLFNRLFSHLNRFLANFFIFTFNGFINLNFFFNFLYLLYPGAIYKNLIHRLWIFISYKSYNVIKCKNSMKYSHLFFIKNLRFSKNFNQNIKLKNTINNKNIKSYLKHSYCFTEGAPVLFNFKKNLYFKKYSLVASF